MATILKNLYARGVGGDTGGAAVSPLPMILLVFAAILAGALFLGGCSVNGSASASAVSDGVRDVNAGRDKVRRDVGLDRPPGIAYGSYLAAQHARMRGDTGAASEFYRDAIAADPENVVLLQHGFSLAIADGAYDRARELAGQLVRIDTSNTLPQIFMLLDGVRSGDYDAALGRLDHIPDNGLNRLMKPLMAAWAHAGADDMDAALEALGALDETAAFRPFLRNHRALLLDYGGDEEAAERAYRESTEAETRGSMRVVLAHAALLARQDRMDEARDLITNTADLFPDTISMESAMDRLESGRLDLGLVSKPANGLADAFYGSATALAQENARSPAIFYLRFALFLRPDFHEAALVLGRLFEMEEQPRSALAVYEQIPDDTDVAEEARLREVWVLEALGRGDEALDRLRDLLTRAPGTVDTVSALANLLRQRDQLDEAIEQYSRAIDLASDREDQRHWVLYYARAIAYDQTDEWAKAEADLKKALALSPSQPDVLNYLGYSWVEQGRRLDEALGMLREAVERRPNDGYIVDSLGWAYYRLNDVDQAIPYLERAVLLRPENPTINEHLGDAYWVGGRRIEARFQWSHALSLGPDSDQKKILRRKIASGLIDGGGVGAAFNDDFSDDLNGDLSVGD